MCTDDIRILQGPLDVTFIFVGTVLLVGGFSQPRVEHTTVERAKMKFTYDYRHIDIIRQMLLGNAVAVTVIADDIAELRCRPRRPVVHPGKPAAHIELVRGHFF